MRTPHFERRGENHKKKGTKVSTRKRKKSELLHPSLVMSGMTDSFRQLWIFMLIIYLQFDSNGLLSFGLWRPFVKVTSYYTPLIGIITAIVNGQLGNLLFLPERPVDLYWGLVLWGFSICICGKLMGVVGGNSLWTLVMEFQKWFPAAMVLGKGR